MKRLYECSGVTRRKRRASYVEETGGSRDEHGPESAWGAWMAEDQLRLEEDMNLVEAACMLSELPGR